MAKQRVVGLTEKALETLRHLAARDKNIREGRPAIQDPNALLHGGIATAPDVYIALPPTGGIPGAGFSSGSLDYPDTPGSADCQIYYKDHITGLMKPVDGLIVDVHNLSVEEIPDTQLVVVKRDKYGVWYIESTGPEGGTGTGTGGTDIAYQTVCVHGYLVQYVYQSGRWVYHSNLGVPCYDEVIDDRPVTLIEYVESVCPVYSSLDTGTGERYLVGIRTTRRRVTIHARSTMGDPFCRDEEDCCEETTGTGTGSGETCCGEDEVLGQLDVAMSGPLGPGNELCDFIFTIPLASLEPLVYEGQGSSPDCGTVYIVIWCQEDSGESEWHVAGEWRGEDGVIHKFDSALVSDGETLSLDLEVSGVDDTFMLAIDHPCEDTTETGTGDDTTVDACDCDAVPRTLYAHFRDGTGSCVCATGVTVALTYNAVTAKWEYIGTLCGVPVTVRFYCYSTPSWAFEVVTSGGGATDTNTPNACSPFVWNSAVDLSPSEICNAAFRVTVNSTP